MPCGSNTKGTPRSFLPRAGAHAAAPGAPKQLPALGALCTNFVRGAVASRFVNPKHAVVTGNGKPQEVNDPDRSASEKRYYALFDSSPSSAEGGCARNPASSSCTWRECKDGFCYAYPKHDIWYGDSASDAPLSVPSAPVPRVRRRSC